MRPGIGELLFPLRGCSNVRQETPGPYPAEVRERAVRLFLEQQDEYPSQWKAIESISAKLSVNHETLRQWVRRADRCW